MSQFKKDKNIQKIYKVTTILGNVNQNTKKSERILRLKYKDATAQKELSFLNVKSTICQQNKLIVLVYLPDFNILDGKSLPRRILQRTIENIINSFMIPKISPNLP